MVVKAKTMPTEGQVEPLGEYSPLVTSGTEMEKHLKHTTDFPRLDFSPAGVSAGKTTTIHRQEGVSRSLSRLLLISPKRQIPQIGSNGLAKLAMARFK